MATDFFDRQDYARRQTVRLLVMFLLAVMAFIVAVCLTAAVAVRAYEVHMQASPAKVQMLENIEGELDRVLRETKSEETKALLERSKAQVEASKAASRSQPSLWHPTVFLWVALGMTLLIVACSLNKLAELSSGGEAVALMLGGREVSPQSPFFAERRLLNVVEEMAVASGIPVPPVYVLDQEPGINAFTAGHQQGDAVVVVSAGCLTYLARDEMQGVIGHEFSHILNGDIKLNLRLVGVVYGIEALTRFGCLLIRGSSDLKDQDNLIPTCVIGFPLATLGYVGVFCGKLIKTAINRQRELLADASAIQFTRNPDGMTRALTKIGGLAEGSQIQNRYAEQISHMFFADAMTPWFFRLFATHPPLAERIRALEPSFDGHFPTVMPLSIAIEGDEESSAAAWPLRAPIRLSAESPPASHGGVLRRMTIPAPEKMAVARIMRKMGAADVEQLRYASQILVGMPRLLLDAVREAFSAQAAIYALLLSRDDETVRARQLAVLYHQISNPLWQELHRQIAPAQSLPLDARLPLLDLAMPAMKRCSPRQYAQFRGIVGALICADGKVDLFEYCLRLVLFSCLDVHFELKKPSAIRFRTIAAIAQPTSVVLSVLAHAGQKQPEMIERAFRAGAQAIVPQAALLPREQCTLRAFDVAAAKLAQASPKLKRAVFTAVTNCIVADGKVTLEERELLRVVAAVLGCPMPATAMTVNDA